MDFIPGMILLTGWNYVPSGWLLCDGQLYSTSKYHDLFKVIGYVYGGNGSTMFAVPNLVGRIPLGAGNQPSSQTISYSPGDLGGAEQAALFPYNLQDHRHTAGSGGFTPSTVTGQSGQMQLEIPYISAPMKETNVPTDAGYPSLAMSSAGASFAYSSKGTDGYMNNTPQAIPIIFDTINFDIDFKSTNPSGQDPVPILPPVQAINYFICCIANSSS
jgi:microcystin-dependent protein